MERIEADVKATQQACQMAVMFGAKPDWPSLDDRIEEFEALLVSEPKQVDLADLELRDALGLRRPRG